MSSPLSLGDVIAIVQKGIALYQKVKAAPDEVRAVGERMESLESYLKRLEIFLDDRNGLAGLRPEEAQELNAVMGRVRQNASRINEVLDKWHKNQGPGGLQIRFEIVAQAWFAIGSGSGELQELADELDRRLKEIDRWMMLLQAFGQNMLLAPGGSAQQKASGKGNTHRDGSTSPAQSPGRSDYNIIFIDAYNEGWCQDPGPCQ